MEIVHRMSANRTLCAGNGRKNALARFVQYSWRMKNTANRKGSVLMEYLVALVFVGAVLMVASARLFYSPVPDELYAGDPRVDPKGFGEIGKKFAGFYQRTAGGLSLPVP